ncbi:MAG: restriction endonuclease subunit S [Bacteroidales bacterium]
MEYKISDGHNPIFLYYLITSSKFLSDLGKLESGKTHRRVNPTDLLKIKIPIIEKERQNLIVKEIEPIQTYISELKKNVLSPQGIIDKVFAREFGFDIDKFEENKNKKFFDVEFSNVLKNNLLRISTHFHHIKLSSLEDKLRDKDFWKPLNTKFKLSGGKRIPKGKTFSNDITDYYYLRPTEVSIWGIEKSDATYISEDLYNQLKRYKIKTGEFCISIVGTLGKTALINTKDLDIEDDNLILSENFIKLTPIQKINNMFFYYYFYSFIFEAQMDREYTITSIKKLGIDKWNYIKIPNIPLEAQQKIVDEIKAELDKQELLKQQITTERNKIDKIIEECIMTAQ